MLGGISAPGQPRCSSWTRPLDVSQSQASELQTYILLLQACCCTTFYWIGSVPHRDWSTCIHRHLSQLLHDLGHVHLLGYVYADRPTAATPPSISVTVPPAPLSHKHCGASQANIYHPSHAGTHCPSPFGILTRLLSDPPACAARQLTGSLMQQPPRLRTALSATS